MSGFEITLIAYIAVWLLLALVMRWYGAKWRDVMVCCTLWPVIAWGMAAEMMGKITRRPK